MKLLKPFSVDYSGEHLIEASAGTGKTYNISSLYIRAIIEANHTVDEILVVTYTEAATKELRDRLMKRLRESIDVLEGASAGDDSFLRALQQNVSNPQQAIDHLKTAIHSFDEAAVYTIHGFCRQALQERAFNSGAPFEAELIGDDLEIIGEIVDDYWRNWVREASENALKRPLLKLMLGQGYSPDDLTNELGGYAGKPYLTVQPENTSIDEYLSVVKDLKSLYSTMQQAWSKDKEEIRAKLLSEPVSGNRFQAGYLDTWMPLMEEWLQDDIIPTKRFDKFDRFSQSYVNESLKKSSIKKGAEPPQHIFFQHVEEYDELADFLTTFSTHFKKKLFDHILENLPPKKEELQVYSFDDLLIQLCDALHHPERGETLRNDLRNTYPIALVDEFQDTDPIQYNIFKSIYAGHHDAALFMIGDPKQSIYSFRGADIFSYLRAKEDAHPQQMYSLGHNYRSIPPLIEAVNALFGSHENPFILDNIPFQAVNAGRETVERLSVEGTESAPLEFRQLIFEEDEDELSKGDAKDRSAKDTAAQIKKLLARASRGEAKIGERAVEASDIAVLVRTHRQAGRVTDALREVGVKSVKHSRESVFQSDEARELYLVLKAVVEPGNERLITAALSSNILGYTANDILELKQNETAWAAKLEQFSELNEMWQKHGFAYMFRKLMQQASVAENVIQLRNGERILTNVVHLSELVMKQEKEGRAGMHTVLKWLLKKRNEENKDAEEEQLRLESDENLVSVVTMHHSKGLEYSIVFCPFLWYAAQKSDKGGPLVYHHPDDKTQVFLDLHGKNDPARSQKRYLQAKEELAESVRLAYVAITRAKYKCVINWVNANDNAYSALGFLLLGSEESFASLEATVDSDTKYDKNNLPAYRSVFNDLGKHKSVSCLHISEIEPNPGSIQGNEENLNLEAKQFERKLPLAKGPGMASFSSLIRNEQDDFDTDFRAYYNEPYDRDESGSRPGKASIFDFPKGPNPGTAIHHIFENIDFDDSRGWDAEIKKQLNTQDIDSKWASVVHNMLRTTLNKTLLNDQAAFTLSKIPAKNMVQELEFYFTTGAVELTEILAIIRPHEDVPESIDGFAEEGFLKGFIDLTFEHNGRFYILDYKTNYLGDSIEDYSAGKLKSEIKEALYDVQYYLYSVALHRYLSHRLNNYSYDASFGGAFYLFLRGINEEGREGIFFDRPDEQIIKQLNTYLNQHS